LGFVSKLGQDLVRLLDPQPGERILDLGCGTGDLAQRIAASGAAVLGLDRSEAMIAEARRKHPRLQLEVGDAASFAQAEPFDAVFSNAALHWIRDAPRVVESIWRALRPGGRFVAEFGGKGNARAVVAAIAEALAPLGIDAQARDPWYFPSLGEYCALLDHQGFRVVQAQHFERPTRLDDGEQGLQHWLDVFAGDFFEGLSDDELAAAYRRTADAARARLYREGAWIVDYVRLRVVALRPAEP
jgi:trans-aconitate methyltransferase